MGAPVFTENFIMLVYLLTPLAHWVSISISISLRCLDDGWFLAHQLRYHSLQTFADQVAAAQDHKGGSESAAAQNDCNMAQMTEASRRKAERLASRENRKNEIMFVTKHNGQNSTLILVEKILETKKEKMTQEEMMILAKIISKFGWSTKYETRYWKISGQQSVNKQTEAECTISDKSGRGHRNNEQEDPERAHATEKTCLKEDGKILNYSQVSCTCTANSLQVDGSHDMKNRKKGTKCVFEIQTSPSSQTSSMNEALLQVKSVGSCLKSYEELCYCEGSFCQLEGDIKDDGISTGIGIHLAELSAGNKEGATLLLLRSLIYQGPVDSRINPQWMLMCWWTEAIFHGLQMAPICDSIKNNVKLGSLMQDVQQEAGVAKSGQSMDGHGDQTGQTLYSKPIKTVLHGAQTTCGQPMDGNGDQTGQSSGKSLPNSATQSEGNGAVNKNTGTGLPNTCGNPTPGGSGDGEDPRRHIKLTPGHYMEESGQAGANTEKSTSKTDSETCSSKQKVPRTNCNPEASGSSASGGAGIDSNPNMEAEQHEIQQTNDATQIGFKHVGDATAATSNPVQSTTHSCPTGVKAHCGTSAYDRPGEVNVSRMGHALAPHFLQNANAQGQNQSVASGGVHIGDNPNLPSEQPNIHETNNTNQPTGNEHTERAVLAPRFPRNAVGELLIAPLHIPPQEGFQCFSQVVDPSQLLPDERFLSPHLYVPHDITDTNLIDSRVKRNQCRPNGEQQDRVGALIDLVEAERVDLREFDPLREEQLRPDVRAANLSGPEPKAGSDVDSLRDGFFRPYQDVTRCDDERSPVSSTDSENSTYGGDSMYRAGSQEQPRPAHFQYNEWILDRNWQWDPGDAANNIQQPLSPNCDDDIPFGVDEEEDDNHGYEVPVDRDAMLPQENGNDNQEAEIVDHLIRPDRAFVDARLPPEDVEVNPEIAIRGIRCCQHCPEEILTNEEDCPMCGRYFCSEDCHDRHGCRRVF